MGSGSLTRLFFVTWNFKPLTAVCVDMAQKMAGTRSRCRRHDVLTALAKQQKKKKGTEPGPSNLGPLVSKIKKKQRRLAVLTVCSLSKICCAEPLKKSQEVCFFFLTALVDWPLEEAV